MTVRFGHFVLDLPRRQLRAGADVRHLTPKAFELLALLVREAPRVVSKQELHEALWPDAHVSDASLVGLIKELRRVLDDRDSAAPVVRTVHRVGYAFTPDVERSEPPAAPVSVGAAYWMVFASRQVRLDQGENIVGRDPAVQVHVDDAAVSRRHARIVVTGRDVTLEDLGSKNGTVVGASRAVAVVTLRDGDRCAFGPIEAVFRAAPMDASTTTHGRHSGGAPSRPSP
jgi:DNA-binding winged helix-turn-helix (wHTH) protein